MPLNATQRAGLIAWVEAAMGSGRKAYWADQEMPRPAKPYATLRLPTSDMQPAPTEQQLGETDGQITHVAHKTHELSVQVFSDDVTGASAPALLGQVLQQLSTVSVRRSLVQAGVRVQNVSSVRNLSAALATKSESRAQADVTLSVVEGLTEQVGWIEQVEAGVTVAPFAERLLPAPIEAPEE